MLWMQGLEQCDEISGLSFNSSIILQELPAIAGELICDLCMSMHVENPRLIIV